ncbi:hypothetical protein OCS_06497 [Ophiocordyceps sinensis CO18]|uniref:Uncharacterized protein n=1 Tax=Ophiocordyceps sinensis (strain Co18 / CGMCC 3.14243) TaxID=911162 RepID=T5A5D2_OPHSC|nr:hypothetical protein OCS_06497 [Ophiocordyceps sinensis CO18]
MWTLCFLLFALPALGDHEQTFRCLTAKDKPSDILIPQLLSNLSSCAHNNWAWHTLACAEHQVHPGVISLTSSLMSTIRRWEMYYNVDFNTAYELQEDWANMERSLNRPQLGLTAWSVLLDSWRKNGELCHYNSDPRYADHLLPRSAGLLSLFIRRDDLRSPILKFGKAWKFGAKTVCSATVGTVRALHQLRTIHSITQQVGTELSPAWRVENEPSRLRELYSTDPFLQGLISGFRDTKFPCPERLKCQDTTPNLGTIYTPHDGRDYLQRISYLVMKSRKVCLIFGGGHLDKNAYYFAVGNVDSEADTSA